MNIQKPCAPADVLPGLRRMWTASAGKIRSIDRAFPAGSGAPVFTVRGRYTAQGWTEWTQGFQFGSALLQFDATGDTSFLERGRRGTVDRMASHLTHFGVHDHGFNNVSTYGHLLRLMDGGRLPQSVWEREFYQVALRVSGAVQARRWTRTEEGGGFIYSFNGPHSLFADTIRSLRSLAWAHRLGHLMFEENDRRVSLLERLVLHLRTSLKWLVYYGEGRDIYDRPGRVSHEGIFNVADGAYRCPGTQQGYSPFSVWTRALAWMMTGCAEELEFLSSLPSAELNFIGGFRPLEKDLLRAAKAMCDFYLENTPGDGIPYWDTGAPGLTRLPDVLTRPADPFNPEEPVDSSAAAIAAQGLLRLGLYLSRPGRSAADCGLGARYQTAGLSIVRRLCEPPYLSESRRHQGLLLHSIYHRPRGWDAIPRGHTVPCGEACMWGDYHLREVALLVQQLAEGSPGFTFYGTLPGKKRRA